MLVHESTAIVEYGTNSQVDTTNDSVFSYVTLTGPTMLVHADHKLNVAPTVWAPRVEFLPDGYAPAGTGTATRRYQVRYLFRPVFVDLVQWGSLVSANGD